MAAHMFTGDEIKNDETFKTIAKGIPIFLGVLIPVFLFVALTLELVLKLMLVCVYYFD